MSFCKLIHGTRGLPRPPECRRWAVALALTAAATLHMACAGAQAQRENWNKPSAPFAVLGNIFYVGTAGLAAYLITTEQGHILIDAALAESAPQIEANIQKL